MQSPSATKRATAHAKNTLVVWRRRATDMARMHDMARTYYTRISAVLTISSLTASVLSSSSSVFGGVVSTHGSDPMGIAMGVLGILSTVMVSINAFVAAGRLQQEHEDCHRKYVKIARDITVHMHLDTVGTDQVFTNIHQCMRYMQVNMDEIEDIAPHIPSHILRRASNCDVESDMSKAVYRFSDGRSSVDSRLPDVPDLVFHQTCNGFTTLETRDEEVTKASPEMKPTEEYATSAVKPNYELPHEDGCEEKTLS